MLYRKKNFAHREGEIVIISEKQRERGGWERGWRFESLRTNKI